MRNVRILVAYDGSRFHGWQRQEGFDSVQEALELAVLSLTSNSVRVHGAGRTDAGVHALGQVAHFHVATALDDSRLRNAINAHLPEGVVVRRLETCADDFHAQFHAQGKRYGYRVLTVRPDPPAAHRRAANVVRDRRRRGWLPLQHGAHDRGHAARRRTRQALARRRQRDPRELRPERGLRDGARRPVPAERALHPETLQRTRPRARGGPACSSEPDPERFSSPEVAHEQAVRPLDDSLHCEQGGERQGSAGQKRPVASSNERT
jgi:tRNA U38,U39,U40 pseudouridine synthase TruA